MPDDKTAATTAEGAAKLAFVAAVPQMALGVANAGMSAANTRTSFMDADNGAAVTMHEEGMRLEGVSAGDGMRSGFGMWVMPMYQNQQSFGLESGNFDTGFKSSFGGIAIGADYTVNDAFRFGLTFNVGAGSVKSSGDFADTSNKFNYWGIGAYAGYQYENFGITADIGCTTTQNALEQHLSPSMGMSDLEADTTAANLSAGLRGEYKVTTDIMDIIPHVGVRVNSLSMKSFDMESAGHTVMEADDMQATIWQFPVGVTFAKDIKTDNGWTVKPQLDLTIIPAAGDLEARQDVKIAGVPGSAEMDSNIMDSLSGRATLGVSAKNDSGVTLGLNYSFQGSAHTADHGVQATFRYDF